MKKQSYRRRSLFVDMRFMSFGIATIVVGVFVVLLRVVMPGVFIAVISPILRTGTALSASVDTLTGSFANISDVVRERDALISKNNKLLIRNRALFARVQDLTQLIGISSLKVPGVVANVLARPPESLYDTLVTDAGSADFVSVGDRVLADGGVPIGTVNSVSKHSSRVVLFSSPEATTTAWIGSKRTPIVLEGAGAGAFTAELPRQASTTIGDTVFVPGYGIQPIGTVGYIDKDKTAVVITLLIRPSVNPFTVTMVEIVPKKSI
ncbi:hypothetical protein MNBD_CPR01-380 [hydrothermal vent metagenome]|uniref:Cell shape-determining protein MreC n=1 Tax=hydrothermal vent metagenome TaxID=652676 RepID=A0A3B0UVU4_9ZZZZ